MTQNEEIIAHMQEFGYITPLEAMSEYGIMRLAARISDLRNLGYHIKSELVSSKNRKGKTVSFSKYTLVSERRIENVL